MFPALARIHQVHLQCPMQIGTGICKLELLKSILLTLGLNSTLKEFWYPTELFVMSQISKYDSVSNSGQGFREDTKPLKEVSFIQGFSGPSNICVCQALVDCRKYKTSCLLSFCHCSTMNIKNRENLNQCFMTLNMYRNQVHFLTRRCCFEV